MDKDYSRSCHLGGDKHLGYTRATAGIGAAELDPAAGSGLEALGAAGANPAACSDLDKDYGRSDDLNGDEYLDYTRATADVGAAGLGPAAGSGRNLGYDGDYDLSGNEYLDYDGVAAGRARGGHSIRRAFGALGAAGLGPAAGTAPRGAAP